MKGLQPKTSLMDIRDFLTTHDCAPAPWETPQGVVDCLYGSLKTKQGDGVFWNDLKGLVDNLEDAQFDRNAFAGSMAFRGTSLSDLVEDLRYALRDDDDGSDDNNGRFKSWARKSLSAASLLSFLLLGSAIGCAVDDGESSESDVTAQIGNICNDSVNTGWDGELTCELLSIINDTNIDASKKKQLLRCLPKLDIEAREALLVHFETLSDEQLAFELRVINFCSIDDEKIEPGSGSVDADKPIAVREYDDNWDSGWDWDDDDNTH